MEMIQFVCPGCGRIHEVIPDEDLCLYTCENCKEHLILNKFGVERPIGLESEDSAAIANTYHIHKSKSGKGIQILMACGQPANYLVGSMHLYLPPDETLAKFFERIDPFAEELSLKQLIKAAYPIEYWTVDADFKKKYHEILMC